MAFDNDPDDDTTMAINNTDADDPAMLDDIFSPNAEKMREIGNAGILTRIDIDLAYSNEKLLNLEILFMHVATRASDCEAISADDEDVSSVSIKKLMEFDLLSGILDSEVRELDDVMSSVQMDIADAHEKISSCEQVEDSFLELEQKLQDSEESFKQLQDQVLEMRTQSAKFQSTIGFHGQESWNNEIAGFSDNLGVSPTSTHLKMQTVEQQRHILGMLEKSLARELDLENKLFNSFNNEDELLMKIDFMEREMSSEEETMEISFWKLFEAENMAEVLMGISKELMGKLHIAQFNLNCSTKRESEMRSKVGLLEDQLKTSNFQLEKEKALTKAILEQRDLLYPKINDLQSSIQDLTEKLSEADSKADGAEAKCKLLSDTNLVLNQEIGLLQSSTNNTDNLNLLEKQLKQSDTHLQHAKALIEANHEKESMLHSSLIDMENLVEDLKAKFSKAETRAVSAEAQCMFLTANNLELNEELDLLRGRIKFLETSLHEADDAKIATAKDIGIRTKLITDMVLRLAMERERIRIQISSLTKVNNIMVEKYWKTKSNASVTASQHGNEIGEEPDFFKNDSVTAQRLESSGGGMAESSATSFQLDSSLKDKPVSENVVGATGSFEDQLISDLDTVRRIEPWQLTSKHVVLAIFIVLLVAFAVHFYQEGSISIRCEKMAQCLAGADQPHAD